MSTSNVIKLAFILKIQGVLFKVKVTKVIRNADIIAKYVNNFQTIKVRYRKI